MGIKRIIILVFFQFIIHLSALASDEGCNTNCSAYFLTKENKRLTGFVVQRFESQSLLSCSLTCLQQSWCTSINFKLISLDGKGICELNKSDFRSDTWSNLNAVPGVIFSKLLKVIKNVRKYSTSFIKGQFCKETVVLHRREVLQDNKVLLTELMM